MAENYKDRRDAKSKPFKPTYRKMGRDGVEIPRGDKKDSKTSDSRMGKTAETSKDDIKDKLEELQKDAKDAGGRKSSSLSGGKRSGSVGSSSGRDVDGKTENKGERKRAGEARSIKDRRDGGSVASKTAEKDKDADKRVASADKKDKDSGEKSKSTAGKKDAAEKKDACSEDKGTRTSGKSSDKSDSEKSHGAHGDHGAVKHGDGDAAKHAAASKERKKKRVAGAIAGIAAVLVVACVAVFGILGTNPADPAQDSMELAYGEDKYTSDGDLINPINWEEWMTRNDNVYAWLKIGDTNVNQPILQHPAIDDYYLTHNIDGEALIDGCLYTQLSYNSKDLTSDKVTVVYGHTFQDNDKMFSTLHNFEDPEFFETHPTFYVYTPTQRLEYEVVSAFEYDNRHILETRDFSDPAVVEEFYGMIQNPESINKNVRNLEEPLDPENDKMLILSTCTKPSSKTARYLVCSVLRDVQSTEDKNVELEDPNLEIETISGPIE